MADPPSQPVSFDDLIALNDEIAALIRAGVPLETGLEGFAGSAAGTMADITARLARRIAAGQTLDEALHGEDPHLPRAYRAIVESGQRTARLPQALESLADYSRNVQSIRQRVSLGLIYPCIVVVAAYYLFWFFLGRILPQMNAMLLAPGEQPSGWVATMTWVHDAVTRLGNIPPILLGLLLAWWLFAGRTASQTRGMAGAMLRTIPGLSGALHRFELANFAELAALLLEHEVPRPTVWRLAAETTGDPRLAADADRLATAAEKGENLDGPALSGTSLPPFMRWMLAAGDRQGALAPSLRQIGAVYRRQATARLAWLKVTVPVGLTLIVGGGAVLLYALALWMPLTETLYKLGSL